MSARDFWSRRRAAVEAEAVTEARAVAEVEVAEREAALADRDEAELLAELDLPDPDTLGAGDDFKAFLSDAVPARLKTRALRRLWLTNPVLANVDGLLDYGEDFTDAAMAVENIQTAYQVGKGMTAHVEELARQAELKAAAEAGDVGQTDQTSLEEDDGAEADAGMAEAEDQDAPALPEQAGDLADLQHEAQQQVSTIGSEDEVSGVAPSRRMRFAFDGAETET
ncbi:DUF3306 domain-containing protein [Tritonibacter scottomollicae]|uniref:DUF3306 domain-containing protein n=1 Tax=Tritonibacter scottomollicae TaxID=483013 RepID=A0ABZ0HFR6_TRISK|nr:DUF3306 domain-containing protein [Tritonibacter scottomollicae]WOI33187.1 DUF3306 domain-containing protein [Tritonibacter scottomollicae]